jgi:hypothetical protein
MSNNETLWQEIFELEFFEHFEDLSQEHKKYYDSAWRWVEALEKDKKIRGIDLIRFKALLEAVYELGKLAGKEDQ